MYFILSFLPLLNPIVDSYLVFILSSKLVREAWIRSTIIESRARYTNSLVENFLYRRPLRAV